METRTHRIFQNRTSGQVSLLILLAFLLAAPATAQLVSLGPEFQVDEDASSVHNCPQVAGRGDRGFTVAWATESSIEARVYTGAAQPLEPTIDVDQGRMEGRTLLEMTVQNRPGQGDLVFWSSNLGTPSSKRFDARRVFPGPDHQIRLRPPSYITRVSPRRTGGYVGAWASKRGIWSLTALNFYGRTVGGSVRVNQTPSEGTYLEVVHAADGSLTALWSTPAPGRVFLRRFGADLHPLGPEVLVADGDGLGGMRMASAPDGRTALTWVDYELSSGAAGTIYVRFFERNGTPASAPQAVFTVPTDQGGNSFHPEAIAVDRQGRALIVWNQVDSARAIEEYRVQLWFLAGPLSEALDVGEDDLRASTPFCADAASAGRSWVVAFRAVGPGGFNDAIWAQRFFSTD